MEFAAGGVPADAAGAEWPLRACYHTQRRRVVGGGAVAFVFWVGRRKRHAVGRDKVGMVSRCLLMAHD